MLLPCYCFERLLFYIIDPTRALFFFFRYAATTVISTLSLHDALPISLSEKSGPTGAVTLAEIDVLWVRDPLVPVRSEEHTSELQSRGHLVCRLLLEKKKKDDPAGAASDLP